MKRKFFLMFAAAVFAAAFTHAQLPMIMLHKKTAIHSPLTQGPPPATITNQSWQGTTDNPISSSPITIDYTNNLVPPSENEIGLFVDGQYISAPSTGANKVYDYGNLPYDASNITIGILRPPHDPNVPGARTAWVQPDYSWDINGLLVDTVSFIYSTNNQGLYIDDISCTAAKVSLKSITGIATDSLEMPKQYISSSIHGLRQKYPITYQSQWINHPGVSGPRLFISLASEGLHHVPVSIVFDKIESTKIAGWGKIRIPTANGPSSYFQCLLSKLSGVLVMSLYVNGRPASHKVSNIFFGNSNYQQKHKYYNYTFLKKGFWDLEGVAGFDMDSTFSTVIDGVFSQTYLNIDCPDGVKMCRNGHTLCIPYAHNLANDEMLYLGATLGACNEENKGIVEAGINTESSMSEKNKFIATTTQLKIYPNPFSSSTEISFTLPQTVKVAISIFDMNGRLVKALANNEMLAGMHQLVWNARDEKGNAVSAGMYFLRMVAGNYTETKKVVFIK